MCPNLKLVVLNGCSTYGQVDELLKEGVPVVIATSSPVEDRKATLFSNTFYQRFLVEEDNIYEACKAAMAVVETNGTPPNFEFQTVKPFRGIHFDGKPKEANWSVYFTNEEDREWTLTKQQKLSKRKMKRYKENDRLIDVTFNALANFSDKVKEKIERAGADEKINHEEQYEMVLEELPDLISNHLRRLLSPNDQRTDDVFYDKSGKERLKQIINTYDTLVDLMSFALLASVWELCKKGDRELPDGNLPIVRQFLKAGEKNRPNFIMIPLIMELKKALIHLLKQEGRVEIFAPEFINICNLLEEDNVFSQAFHHLDRFKEFLSQKGRAPDEEAMTEACMEAEDQLTQIFKELGFLAKYSIYTVIDINVVLWRHQEKASFRHRIQEPSFATSTQGTETRNERMDVFIPNKSVILVKKNERLTTENHLNLSPFVMDANAFDPTASLPKLHFFYYYDEDLDVCCYKHVYKPQDPMLETDEEIQNKDAVYKYSILKTQLNAFSELFFEEKLEDL